ncbi:hypothetical protein L198_07320 [Cryptococcus wingfieldii CBS 7118]|uniref:Uncharacterized protein n=1 Tax=Cryptococcus wingfieldii CBS 7118 TaxID=1295528 RepID=A0A1E3ICG3_9TREE|nr:hypothetical protein L198_07320 [Cryptococcus wingfieldii CBS 7118]ODN86302.1 hypothetical protein L198_07320 [Cryptococcus wingfieldii CBS 7118]
MTHEHQNVSLSSSSSPRFPREPTATTIPVINATTTPRSAAFTPAYDLSGATSVSTLSSKKTDAGKSTRGMGSARGGDTAGSAVVDGAAPRRSFTQPRVLTPSTAAGDISASPHSRERRYASLPPTFGPSHHSPFSPSHPSLPLGARAGTSHVERNCRVNVREEDGSRGEPRGDTLSLPPDASTLGDRRLLSIASIINPPSASRTFADLEPVHYLILKELFLLQPVKVICLSPYLYQIFIPLLYHTASLTYSLFSGLTGFSSKIPVFHALSFLEVLHIKDLNGLMIFCTYTLPAQHPWGHPLFPKLRRIIVHWDVIRSQAATTHALPQLHRSNQSPDRLSFHAPHPLPELVLHVELSNSCLWDTPAPYREIKALAYIFTPSSLILLLSHSGLAAPTTLNHPTSSYPSFSDVRYDWPRIIPSLPLHWPSAHTLKIIVEPDLIPPSWPDVKAVARREMAVRQDVGKSVWALVRDLEGQVRAMAQESLYVDTRAMGGAVFSGHAPAMFSSTSGGTSAPVAETGFTAASNATHHTPPSPPHPHTYTTTFFTQPTIVQPPRLPQLVAQVILHIPRAKSFEDASRSLIGESPWGMVARSESNQSEDEEKQGSTRDGGQDDEDLADEASLPRPLHPALVNYPCVLIHTDTASFFDGHALFEEFDEQDWGARSSWRKARVEGKEGGDCAWRVVFGPNECTPFILYPPRPVC